MSEKSDRARPSQDSDPKPEPAKRDTVLIHGVSEDGQNLAVLRARDDHVEAGVVRRVKEGESIHGELVRLKPRAEFPLLCDVEVALESPHKGPARLSHGGPAQVATDSYRANWDAIWSKKPHGKASAPN